MCLAAALPTKAQLRINEVCSKNNAVLRSPDGKFPDWIEIYNSSTNAVNLSTYFLSDEAAIPHKWQFPNIFLAANDYLVFFSGSSAIDPDQIDFKIASSGETIVLTDNSFNKIDELKVPALQADHSFGTIATNNLNYYFQIPTPNEANTAIAYNGYSSLAVADVNAGVYKSSRQINLNGNGSGRIYYSLDGRRPTINGRLYTGSISIDTSTLLQFIHVEDSLIPSKVSVSSIIIKPEIKIPILSISSEPDSLFSFERGIYMKGPNASPNFPYYGANFWEDRVVPANFEYFDESGQLKISQQVDLKIHGGTASRNKVQRPFRFIAKDKYGSDKLDFNLFKSRPNSQEHKRLIARNTGSDFGLAQMRDPFFHQLILDNNLDIDVLAVQPVEVYINGVYWGMQNLRERIDKNYLEHTYGVDKDSVIILEEENFRIEGDSLHFSNMFNYIKANDLHEDKHFRYADSLLDLSNIKDYYALQFYAGNADWPHNNLKYWKPSYNTGKYRYLLFDLDATMLIFGWIPKEYNGVENALFFRKDSIHPAILNGLLDNTEFKRGFINRFADLLNTSLSVENVQQAFDDYTAVIENSIPDHFSRWQLPLSNYNDHHDSRIPDFLLNRSSIVQKQINDYFQLAGRKKLHLSSLPENAGKIGLNTIDAKLPFYGIYFDGNAIDISANAKEGFTFDHWELYDGELERFNSASIMVNLDADTGIKAIYRSTEKILLIFPNPIDVDVEFLFPLADEGNGSLCIYNMLGQCVYDEEGFYIKGANYVKAELPYLATGTYIVVVKNESETLHAQMIKN